MRQSLEDLHCGVEFRWCAGSGGGALLRLAAGAQDKDSFTPMPLDSGFGHMDMSDRRDAAGGDHQEVRGQGVEFQDALNHYTYRRMARVQTVDDDNKVDGEYYEVDDVIFDPSGRRTEKVGVCAGKLADAGDDVAVGLAGYSAWLSVCADGRGDGANTTSNMWGGRRWTRSIATSST